MKTPKTQQSVTTLLLVAIGMLVGLILVLSASQRPAKQSDVAGSGQRVAGTSGWNSPTPAVKPPGPYSSGIQNLVGASPEQVGQFAVDYFQAAGYVRSGVLQVLHTRSIKPEQMPQLDLGCPLEFAAIEEPPLVLVVLRGDVNLRVPGNMRRDTPPGISYVAAIFDIWSAQPTFLTSSQDGAGFAKVLNDSSLPIRGWGTALVCPTPLPFTKTVHYGEALPGWLTPPVPLLTPSAEVETPTVIVPSPVPTTDS